MSSPLITTTLDASAIAAVINKAAAAYEAILGPEFDCRKYMPAAEVENSLEVMTFYAALRGESLLGVMAYQPHTSVALVRHAYVLPAHQGRGIGGLLIGRIVEVAREAGYERLLVGTYAANLGAIRFYQGHGFAMVDDAQELLARYWEDVPEGQAAKSTVLGRRL